MSGRTAARSGRKRGSIASVRRVAVLALLAVAFAACTVSETPSPPEPSPTPNPTPPAEDPYELGVIGSVTGPGRSADAPVLDGMALAEAEINAAGGIEGRPLRLRVVDDGSDETATGEALDAMLRPDGPAGVLVAGPGASVVDLRQEIQALGRPVVLLGGDLYSDRLLFRQVFQTAPPLRWQARVVARYLVRDRGHRRVVAVRESGDPARAAFLEELAAEGVEAAVSPADGRLGERARDADALIALVGLPGLADVLEALADLEDPPQLVLPAELLRSDLGALPPGTVAPGPYTWAPWARPIPRVREFRSSFERTIGHLPVGAEQEGYDGVRIIAEGLVETGGRSGEPLVRFLEGNRPAGPVYSSTSVTLSPDDHLFAGELWFGMFAVAGRGERAEPWIEGVRWRPIIRTFSYTGERTLYPERDRRVFFPFWRPGRPSPKYHRSRWGIVTGPGDPLH